MSCPITCGQPTKMTKSAVEKMCLRHRDGTGDNWGNGFKNSECAVCQGPPPELIIIELEDLEMANQLPETKCKECGKPGKEKARGLCPACYTRWWKEKNNKKPVESTHALKNPAATTEKNETSPIAQGPATQPEAGVGKLPSSDDIIPLVLHEISHDLERTAKLLRNPTTPLAEIVEALGLLGLSVKIDISPMETSQ